MSPRAQAILFVGAFCVVAMVSSAARADNANPNLIPLGENESFLGNTGVGRPNDTGAVYYNPAGLAEIGSGRVALSGTVYASITEHFDSIAVIENANVPFDAGGFNAIPSSLVGTLPLGDWVGAFSVLVPISIQLDDHATLNIPNFTTNLAYSSTETEVWYGLSIARKLGRQFALGLSVYGIQHTQSNLAAIDLVSSANTGGFGDVIQRESLSVYGLLATLGVSYIASDTVRFGLRAQTAMAQIYGKGESYGVTRAVAPDGTATASGENVTGAANYGIPFDFSFGTAVKPAEWLTLLADVSLQLATSYQEFPASTLNEPVNLQAVPRLNIGVEAVPGPAHPIRLGFYYDPSAQAGHPGDENYQKVDVFGVTAGVGFNSEHVRTTVGGFAIVGHGERTSTAPASASFSVTGLGAMLTTAYVF